MKKKFNLMIGMSLVITLIVINNVFAFGVASPGITTEMHPGETKVITLEVQNKAGATEDVAALMGISKNPDNIAIMNETEYLVRAGESVFVPVTIQISKEAKIGTLYAVVVSTRTKAPDSQAGGVAFGIGVDSKIPIFVVENTNVKEQKLSPILIVIILAVLVIAILVISLLILRNRRRL
jgi:hypothetical protein